MTSKWSFLRAGVSGWIALFMLIGCAGQPAPDAGRTENVVVEKHVGTVTPATGRYDAGRAPFPPKNQEILGEDGEQGSFTIQWEDGKTEMSGTMVTEDGEVYQFQSGDSPRHTDRQTEFEQSIDQQIAAALQPTSGETSCYTIEEAVDAQAGERVLQCTTGRTITMIARQGVDRNTYWEIKNPDMRMMFKQKQFATIEDAAHMLCGCLQ